MNQHGQTVVMMGVITGRRLLSSANGLGQMTGGVITRGRGSDIFITKERLRNFEVRRLLLQLSVSSLLALLRGLREETFPVVVQPHSWLLPGSIVSPLAGVVLAGDSGAAAGVSGHLAEVLGASATSFCSSPVLVPVLGV